jgi:glycine cleavage system H lipoate-binding protein
MSRKINKEKINMSLENIADKLFKIGIRPELCNKLISLAGEIKLAINEKNNQENKGEQIGELEHKQDVSDVQRPGEL